uniref:Uncharacterized protein n=1 Tax=Macrostomum lignano TaxID=282301 RepID=A0A1I8FUI8_9PLAT
MLREDLRLDNFELVFRFTTATSMLANFLPLAYLTLSAENAEEAVHQLLEVRRLRRVVAVEAGGELQQPAGGAVHGRTGRGSSGQLGQPAAQEFTFERGVPWTGESAKSNSKLRLRNSGIVAAHVAQVFLLPSCPEDQLSGTGIMMAGSLAEEVSNPGRQLAGHLKLADIPIVGQSKSKKNVDNCSSIGLVTMDFLTGGVRQLYTADTRPMKASRMRQRLRGWKCRRAHPYAILYQSP